MKKTLFYLLAFILSGAIIFSAMGCAGGAFPGYQTYEFPADEGVAIDGTWSGVWGSYEQGGKNGLIESLTLTENKDIVNYGGSIVLNGMEGVGTGSVEGTLENSVMTFTASFAEGVIIVFEGTKVGTSCNGSYTRYDNNEKTDWGTFVITKK